MAKKTKKKPLPTPVRTEVVEWCQVSDVEVDGVLRYIVELKVWKVVEDG